MLSGEIDDNVSNIVVAELLYLDSLNHDDIQIYINSPGGSITSGMAIYDTMNFIKSDVSNNVYVFAPGEIIADANGNNITFTKLNSSFNIKNETLTYDDLKRRATNLMNQIEWVQCLNYKDYNEYYGTNLVVNEILEQK